MKTIALLVFSACLCGCWSSGVEKVGLRERNGSGEVAYKTTFAFFFWPIPPAGIGFDTLHVLSVLDASEKNTQTNVCFFALLNPTIPTIWGKETILQRDRRYDLNSIETGDGGIYYLHNPQQKRRNLKMHSREHVLFFSKDSVGEDVLLWRGHADDTEAISHIICDAGEMEISKECELCADKKRNEIKKK